MPRFFSSRSLATCCALSLLGGCGGASDSDVGIPDDTPALSPTPGVSVLAGDQPIAQEVVRGLVDGLVFDSALSADTVLSDVTIVEVPVQGLQGLSHEELAAGRIIARMDATGDVPSAGIHAGTYYTYVDSVATGAWRALHIPEPGNEPFVMPEALQFTMGPDTVPSTPMTIWMIANGAIIGPCYPCFRYWCTKVLRPF